MSTRTKVVDALVSTDYGKEITVKGWVRSHRSSKAVDFIALNDGSTVYPRGLIVGTVVDAGFEETGVAKFALLDPAAEISSLEQVFIITQYTTEAATTRTTTETQPTEAAPSTEPQTSETAAG